MLFNMFSFIGLQRDPLTPKGLEYVHIHTQALGPCHVTHLKSGVYLQQCLVLSWCSTPEKRLKNATKIKRNFIFFVPTSVLWASICFCLFLSLSVSAVEHSHAAVINYRLPPARSHPSLVLLHEAVYSAPGFTIDCSRNCRKWCFEINILSIVV